MTGQYPGEQPGTAGTEPVCPVHPDRVSYVRCQRCGRPTCFECQHTAPVGVQCPQCVAKGRAETPQPRVRPPGSVKPIVTYVLIGLCAVVFLGQLSNDEVTRRFAFAPILGADEPWRFLSAAFVHSPTFYGHILFNMYALWITGQYLEPMLGRVRFLALYLISAVGGSVGFLFIVTLQPQGWFTSAVGASGAVFGLFAALFVLNRHLGRQTGGILVVLGINAALGFMIPNVAWEAHLGGALTGAAIAGVFIATLPRSRDAQAQRRRAWQWPGLLLVLLVLVAVAVYALWPVLSLP